MFVLMEIYNILEFGKSGQFFSLIALMLTIQTTYIVSQLLHLTTSRKNLTAPIFPLSTVVIGVTVWISNWLENVGCDGWPLSTLIHLSQSEKDLSIRFNAAPCSIPADNDSLACVSNKGHIMAASWQTRHMTVSGHGNAFDITGPLWAESTNDLWILHTEGSIMHSFDFLLLV